MNNETNSPEFWDELAKPCSCYERRSDYADEFIKKSGILEGESVFDMGCGSGTLCLPLADDGHQVFCADFSTGMLKSVNDVIREEGLDLLVTEKLSWEEDWNQRDLPVCDLAFASRCLIDVDPDDAVEKLSSHARKRVCMTLPVNADMFKNKFVRYQLGMQEDRKEYLVAMLSSIFRHGYMPSLSYMAGKDGGKGWAFISWDLQ